MSLRALTPSFRLIGLSVTLACSANPASVFPGDPVTVTATAGNLEPKLNMIYSLAGPGMTATESTASESTPLGKQDTIYVALTKYV